MKDLDYTSRSEVSTAEPAATKRFISLNLIPALSLSAWLACLSIPVTGLRDYLDFRQDDQVLGAWQPVGLGFFLALVATYLPAIASRGSTIRVNAKLFVVAVATLTLASLSFLYSIDQTRSMTYIVLLISALIGLRIYWLLPERERLIGTQLAAITILTSIGVALIRNGGVTDRWIGGLHPNWTGQWMCAVAVLASFARPRVGVLTLFGALLVTTYVSSRGAILFLVVFGLLRYVLPSIARHGVGLFVTLLSGGTLLVALLVIVEARTGAVFESIDRTLAISDQDRGMGTGVTGRQDLWSAGLQIAEDYQWTGAGFRMARSEQIDSAHSGLIELMIDFGVWGAFLYAGVFIAALVLLVRGVRLGPRHNNTDLLFGSFFVAFSLLATLEPLYFSLGNVLGVVALLVLVAPTSLGERVNAS